MSVRKKVRLGDILVEKGYLSKDQLEKAVEYQASYAKENDGKRIRIGEAISAMGYVAPMDIALLLADQLEIEFIDLRKVSIDESLVEMVGDALIRKTRAIPFRNTEGDPNSIDVAMEDPMDYNAIDDISIVTGKMVNTYIALSSDISAQIDALFGKQSADAMADAFKKEQEAYNFDEDDGIRREDVENSPVVRLVNELIERAVVQRASDIHIEPFENFIKLRYRIDGALREIARYDKALYGPIIARLKVISGMDISEKRKPQDGRITIIVSKKEYDIRVSNLPTVFGEKVVMRIASKEGFNKKKEDLGMTPENLEVFNNILSNPNGIILVTGPTGSGKSTTLYTALRELAKPDVNVITVEDPVEANVDNVNQVQVNPKAELTFASALRSILRQDPDIIMIGEIRDGETAGIAVKASITGHLVVSTLHTNSTAATISRLVDMGVEPYLLGDSLVGVIAQRLVRRVCECHTSREATEDEKRKMGYPIDKPLKINIAKKHDPDSNEIPCPVCGGSGYYGRIGVYEIMPITSKIKRLINERATADVITAAAQAEGMYTLRQASAKLVIEGVSTFEEMMKISYDIDDDIL